MRTLVAAAEPPERRPVDGYSFTRAPRTSSSAADTVLAFAAGAGITVTPWQAVVVRRAYAATERIAYGRVIEGEIVEQRPAIES